jgi:hypothetical protein
MRMLLAAVAAWLPWTAAVADDGLGELRGRAVQAMLGQTKAPWLVLASGSVVSEALPSGGPLPATIEWEPCSRRVDVRPRPGFFARPRTAKAPDALPPWPDDALETLLGEAGSILCGSARDVSVIQNQGRHVRIRFELRVPSARRLEAEVDRESGLVSSVTLEDRFAVPVRTQPKAQATSWRIVSRKATLELSDYRRVGLALLPHHALLREDDLTREWSWERIEVVPLP